MRVPLRSFSFYLLGLFGVALLSGACATAPTTPTATADRPAPSVDKVYRSERYIVYVLKGTETAASLAEKFLGDPKKAWVIEDANEGIPFVKDQPIAIPLMDDNRAGLFRNGFQVVPILCYHDFAKACKSSLCVPESLFEEQMRYLKENNYRVITLGELLAFLEYRQAIPKRAVVITIDDGYRSTYDIVYPIMKNYGFRATLFIYTAFVGASRNAVTWDQLREMKEYGFEIGSHTINHIDLTKVLPGEEEKDYLARIGKELKGSKDLIDSKLSQDTKVIAFPYGKLNQTVMEATTKAGYKMGVSVKRGGNPVYSDPLQLRRNQILKADMGSFIGSLQVFQDISLEEKL